MAVEAEGPRRRYTRALVTGVRSGMGKAFADMLLDEGIEVWGTSRRPASIPPRRGLHMLNLDLASGEGLEQVLELSTAPASGIDLLINNAGYGVFSPVDGFPEEQIRKQIEVLLAGPIRICQRVYGSMRSAGSGVIVNVSSLAAEFPMPYMSLYNACKSGLSAFSRSLMIESVGTGIAVIDFQPGDFRTAFNKAVWKDERRLEQSAELAHAWESVDRNFRQGPEVALAARRLKRILDNPKSGVVTVGGFFQARLAPFLARFVSSRARTFIIRKYYRLPG